MAESKKNDEGKPWSPWLGLDPGVVAAISGVVAFGVVFALLPGLGGAVLGAAAGALGFFGVRTLLTPDPTIGGVAVDEIRNGDKVKAVIDSARVFRRKLAEYEAKAKDQDVKRGIGELSLDLDRLVGYVESNPGKWGSLAHWMNTFSDTAVSALDNYCQLEQAGTAGAPVRQKALKSLDALDSAARGELADAMKGNAMSLDADAEALERLARQDGYTTGSRRPRDDRGSASAEGLDRSEAGPSTNPPTQSSWSGLTPLA